MALKDPLQRLVVRTTEALVRFLLRRQIRIPPSASDRAMEIAARTDELNVAAEAYFANIAEPAYLLGKPYSDPVYFPRFLHEMGVLTEYLRVGPGDTVLEMGAGTCWVSHFLNLFGCHTISVDVSPTALALGRQLFRRDRRTRWELGPVFLPYDGHRLPLADGVCDRVIIHDAYHHFPNPDEILAELYRVLRPGGIVAMSEPGREHSLAEATQREVALTGVLENDVVVERLEETARAVGFTRATVVPVRLQAPEVPARDFTAFLQGEGFVAFWQSLAKELLHFHFILLYKGEPRVTTRKPGRLAARIEPAGEARSGRLTAAVGEEVRLECAVRNLGDTVWLGETVHPPGVTRLGVHLLATAEDEPQDWARAILPTDLSPGESTTLTFTVRAPDQPGMYRLVLDMVAEGLYWFAAQGSETTVVDFEVHEVRDDLA